MPAQTPIVSEVTLSRMYPFMYANFLIVTQQDLLLMLEMRYDKVAVLQFDSHNMRYGPPNDEARGGHPLSKYGLGFYGLFEVRNSPWIREQMVANRVHPRHVDAMFDGRRHYVACFKDVMLEVICQSFEEKEYSR